MPLQPETVADKLIRSHRVRGSTPGDDDEVVLSIDQRPKRLKQSQLLGWVEFRPGTIT